MIGPVIAIGLLAAILASIIPWILRERREMKELERISRCGPGCICAGENLRARQGMTVYAQAPQSQPNYQQQPSIIIVQTPQSQPIQQPAQAPIILLQAPQPQPIQQPQAAPQIIYLPPAPQETYQQTAHQQAPMSYYAGPAPHVEDYQPEVRYLPPSQPVGYLPQANAKTIDEARRAFERERELERNRGR